MKNLFQLSTAIITIILLSFSSSLFAGPSTGRYFFIQAKISTHGLSNNNSMKVNAPMVQKPGPKDSQRWRFIPAGKGYYYILSKKSGLYLKVKGSSKRAQAIIVQSPMNESSALKWKLEKAGKGYYFIRSKVSGLYLDVKYASKANGAAIWQYPLNKTDAQKWRLIDAGKVFNINKAVSASLFGNSKKGLYILGHKFNFGEAKEGIAPLSITNRGSYKIIEGIFIHNVKAQYDDVYIFRITVNSRGELVKFGKTSFGLYYDVFNRKKFSKNDFKRVEKYKNIGKIPLTGNKISASDRHLGAMQQNASKHGFVYWEEAAEQIAVILAVAILNQQ